MLNRLLRPVLAALLVAASSSPALAQTNVTVQNNVLGRTYKYSGVNCNTIQSEDIAYSSALGSYITEVPFNMIRVRGGIVRDASTPFDGFTVAQVKANPQVLNWTNSANWYAKNFTTWASGLAGKGVIVSPMLLWSRHTTSSGGCNRAAVFQTQADQDVFWIAAFGMAYWANVINKYGLTHMEVSNEPDNCGGNGVSTPDVATHDRMIELAKDAFTYVNQTSGLVNPPLAANLVAPGVMTESTAWVQTALATTSTRNAIDVVSYHAYWEFHLWDQATSSANDINSRAPGKRLWMDEWGAFWYGDGYSNTRLVEEMAPVMPVLGLYGIESQAVWNLYGAFGGGCDMNLVCNGGQKSRFYWETKMLNRALLSEKDLLSTNLPNRQGYQQADTFFAWGTRDSNDLFVILMNHTSSASQVAVDVSAFPGANGKSATVYYVPASSPYGESSLGPTPVTSGRFNVATQAGTHYVAVIPGGSNGTGRSDGGAAGSTGAGGSPGTGGGGGSETCPPGGDVEQYGFENGAQGWTYQSGGAITGVAASADRASAGTQSLKVTLNGAAAKSVVYVGAPPLPIGATVSYRIWLPAGAPLASVQAYAVEGAAGNWTWHGDWRDTPALVLGDWNTFSVSVPAGAAAIDSIGFEVTTNATFSGTLYIDSVGWGCSPAAGGAGGSTGSGGSTGAGGSVASGGTTGAGGSVASGGTTGADGSVASGAATGAGGSIGSGGSTGAGGATAGRDASGGTGGSSVTGGVHTDSGAGGSPGGAARPVAEPAGCGCRVASTPSAAGWALSLLGLFAVLLRRRATARTGTSRRTICP